ncbi:MAG: efflux RND transporter periplasmic adaptor subunit [Desulfobacteraceae bacterium]|nr:MAG: efflux RND transporter periplasmic adaptor subunit [Desulfobacteraceae bacterium]
MKKNPRKFMYAALLVLACLGLYQIFFKTRPDTGPDIVIAAAVRSFSIEVNTIGMLDAAKSNMITSSLKSGKGKIIRLVEDGTWVETGDLLVQLDPLPFEEEVARLQGEIKKLTAAVDANQQLFEWEKSQVEKELSTAEFNVRKAELELSKYAKGEGPLQLALLKEEKDKISKESLKYTNYLNDLKKLKSKGYDHPSEIAKADQEVKLLNEKLAAADRKYLSYQEHIYPSMIEEYSAEVEHAEMLLEQTRESSVHKIAQAKSSLDEVTAGLENQEKLLEQARKQLQETTIKAPSAGIVILYETFRDGQKRKPRAGDTVLQNQPVLYLPDISTMMVKTSVREVDLHKVKIGQPCAIRADAYPERKYEGRVSFIGALASDRSGGSSGAKYFQMTVEMTSQDPDLRPGMTARVNILTEQVDNALTLPLIAVFEENEKYYCSLAKNRAHKKVYLTVGRYNEDFIEILDGIQAGDVVSTFKP